MAWTQFTQGTIQPVLSPGHPLPRTVLNRVSPGLDQSILQFVVKVRGLDLKGKEVAAAECRELSCSFVLALVRVERQTEVCRTCATTDCRLPIANRQTARSLKFQSSI